MELSSTLIGFQPDNIQTLPVNFMELSLLGSQIYTSLYMQKLVQQNARYSPNFVSMSSFGAKQRGNNAIAMHCFGKNRSFFGQLPGVDLRFISRIKPIIPRWMLHKNLRNSLVGLCFCVTAILCNNYSLKIPYSEQTHFILCPQLGTENDVGEFNYMKTYKGWKDKNQVLPRNHPSTILVEPIFKRMIRVFHNGLNLDYNDNFSTTSGEVVLSTINKGTTTNNDIFSSSNKPCEEMFNRLNLVYGTAHLVRRIWGVIVLDDEDYNAYYYGDTGRVFATNNYINYICNSEEEKIAYTLGHEIGHALTAIRRLEVEWYILVIVMAFDSIFPKNVYGAVLGYLALYICSKWSRRRAEMVADYIGLMLMAAAGYDPRTIPDHVRRGSIIEKISYEYIDEKLDERLGSKFKMIKYIILEARKVVDFFIATHPPSRKRATYLEEAMEEAVAIYEQVRGVQYKEERLMTVV